MLSIVKEILDDGASDQGKTLDLIVLASNPKELPVTGIAYELNKNNRFVRGSRPLIGATHTLQKGGNVQIFRFVLPQGVRAKLLVRFVSLTRVGKAPADGIRRNVIQAQRLIRVRDIRPLPAAKFVTSAALNQTAAEGDITGANYNCLTLTANGANAYTLRTAEQTLDDIPNGRPGQAFMVRIANKGNNTVTVTQANGWTLTGTMTIATNTYRDFVMTFNSQNTATLQSVGNGSAT